MTLNRPASRVLSLHDFFVRCTCSLQSPFLLVLRLFMGWQFAIAGWAKLHSVAQITGFFTSLHLPFPAFTAVFVANVEFFGGILLMLGLFSRITGLVLAINMLVAYITADRDSFLAWDFDKFTKADPFTFLIASLTILIFGAGVFSVDWLLKKRWGTEASA